LGKIGNIHNGKQVEGINETFQKFKIFLNKYLKVFYLFLFLI